MKNISNKDIKLVYLTFYIFILKILTIFYLYLRLKNQLYCIRFITTRAIRLLIILLKKIATKFWVKRYIKSFFLLIIYYVISYYCFDETCNANLK